MKFLYYGVSLFCLIAPVQAMDSEDSCPNVPRRTHPSKTSENQNRQFLNLNELYNVLPSLPKASAGISGAEDSFENGETEATQSMLVEEDDVCSVEENAYSLERNTTTVNDTDDGIHYDESEYIYEEIPGESKDSLGKKEAFFLQGFRPRTKPVSSHEKARKKPSQKSNNSLNKEENPYMPMNVGTRVSKSKTLPQESSAVISDAEDSFENRRADTGTSVEEENVYTVANNEHTYRDKTDWDLYDDLPDEFNNSLNEEENLLPQESSAVISDAEGDLYTAKSDDKTDGDYEKLPDDSDDSLDEEENSVLPETNRPRTESVCSREEAEGQPWDKIQDLKVDDVPSEKERDSFEKPVRSASAPECSNVSLEAQKEKSLSVFGDFKRGLSFKKVKISSPESSEKKENSSNRFESLKRKFSVKKSKTSD